MSIQILEKYLPHGCQSYLKHWFGDYYIHIKITKDRASKLGDYRKLPDKSHLITINATLEPQLFFFVLTHELAHLIAFENFGHRIAPHGAEWKVTFGKMIIESLANYSEDLQSILIKFAKSPKANFMASPELVRYFKYKKIESHLTFVEDLGINDVFLYKNEEYKMLGRLKKNYLCKQLNSGREYRFSSLAKVEKII